MIIGLVGKPSAGKSTFFKAATLAEVEIASYPFTTINKNEGFGYVKIDCVDKEFNKECNPKHGFCLHNKRFAPVQVIDVAGLVPDAHLGKGRGNQFLDDLRQADMLIHIVDVSGSLDAEGNPVEPGSHDPAQDILFLEKELDHWYMGILQKGWERFVRQVMAEKAEVYKALGKQLSGLKITERMIEAELNALGMMDRRPNEWTDDDLFRLAVHLRKLTKPMVIACNKIDVHRAAEHFVRLQNRFPDHTLVACSAESELALREAAKHGLIDYIPGESTFRTVHGERLSDRQKTALQFVQEKVLDEYGTTGVQDIFNTSTFDVLRCVAVFPVATSRLEDSDGRVLPDCLLLPPNSTALDLAFALHTDIGEKFIRAIDLKRKLTVGKEHVLQNRDVIEIVADK